jgi:hypothetical protein
MISERIYLLFSQPDFDLSTKMIDFYEKSYFSFFCLPENNGTKEQGYNGSRAEEHKDA